MTKAPHASNVFSHAAIKDPFLQLQKGPTFTKHEVKQNQVGNRTNALNDTPEARSNKSVPLSRSGTSELATPARRTNKSPDTVSLI